MTTIDELHQRAESKCELCSASDDLNVFSVEPPRDGNEVLACAICREQLDSGTYDALHWRGLAEAMWSPQSAVQVTAWRTLRELKNEPWAQDLLDQAYLDEATMEWATANDAPEEDFAETYDSNGTQLFNGDSVTLIKDLDVKGAGFTAKRGTMVRGIRLTQDGGLIEGKVNKMAIVLKTEFLKKA